MKIYFACSITGGREFESVYQAIVAALLADGHEVPTAHLTRSGVTNEEGALAPHYVYERDINWIEGCDILIAEVSVPSHGVGYEIGYALNAGKRVICLYREGRKVSKMITGNPHVNLSIKVYTDESHAISLVRDLLFVQ